MQKKKIKLNKIRSGNLKCKNYNGRWKRISAKMFINDKILKTKIVMEA